jgi:hypothetical protein
LATRSHTTFKKRQKEQARQEKQQEKMARRLQKKTERPEDPTVDEDGIAIITPDDSEDIAGETIAALSHLRQDSL